MVVGSVLAGVPTLAVIAIALAGVAAAGAAARSPIGTESGRPSSTASCSGSPARPPRRSAFSLISSTSAGQPVPRCWSCAPVRTCNDYAASAACSQSSPVLSLGPRSSERHLAGVVQHRRPGGARRGGGHQRQSLVRRPGLHHRTRVPITPVRRPRQRRAPLSRTRGRNRPRSGAGIFLRAGGAEAARTVAWPRAPGLTVDEQFLDRSGGSGLNHRVGSITAWARSGSNASSLASSASSRAWRAGCEPARPTNPPPRAAQRNSQAPARSRSVMVMRPSSHTPPPGARATACTPGRAASATVSSRDAHSRQRGDRHPVRGRDGGARVSPVASATGRAATVDPTGTRSGGGAAAPRHHSGRADRGRYGRRDHRAARDAQLTRARRLADYAPPT